MTTILAIFIIALALSLMLTPLSRKLGVKLGAMDAPNHRKVHIRPIPRTGGLAIFLSFVLAIICCSFMNTNISNLLVISRQTLFLAGGALVCLSAGLIDDFRNLGPEMKFIAQIIGASLAFAGGFDLQQFNILGVVFDLGPVPAYLITLLWFVLFINAINLIDGLDGLAGGIVFFASVVMVILSILKGNLQSTALFAALGGSVLGFLRYNFNPASIFLGDGGSYFLGYCVAGLSIMGSVKSQIGVAVLIPLLAMGVPLFDTILSPVRRFVVGKKMFHPDKEHVHHRLLKMGFSTKKAVWVIYVITFSLCLLALAAVNLRDERAGLFLIVLGAGALIFVRKLGYLEYPGYDKFYGWLKGLTDETGLGRERRSFLNRQMEINRSGDIKDLWRHICGMTDWLDFDLAEMDLRDPERAWGEETDSKDSRSGEGPACIGNPSVGRRWVWIRDGFERNEDPCKEYLFKLELPLLVNGGKYRGALWLVKDLRRGSISHYTLRRVEHMRRSVTRTLGRLSK
ncbi:MAG: undecaprenyl/decaprenyl-phosphate alpha-N-acetylglucosaminyl 1-phosphate transferase [Proteobacteria bacterium]|nr:undecaprenyl/decaprenyl-phosphate alpha-N-acetylglucosaminyl 1-phosphate transferase [Pseudomonadota bacterium]